MYIFIILSKHHNRNKNTHKRRIEECLIKISQNKTGTRVNYFFFFNLTKKNAPLKL